MCYTVNFSSEAFYKDNCYTQAARSQFPKLPAYIQAKLRVRVREEKNSEGQLLQHSNPLAKAEHLRSLRNTSLVLGEEKREDQREN